MSRVCVSMDSYGESSMSTFTYSDVTAGRWSFVSVTTALSGTCPLS